MIVIKYVIYDVNDRAQRWENELWSSNPGTFVMKEREFTPLQLVDFIKDLITDGKYGPIRLLAEILGGMGESSIASIKAY